MITSMDVKERKPDRRLPGTPFHSNLYDVLVSLAQGKRLGKAENPLPNASLLHPGRFPPLYHWSSEPGITYPQKIAVKWFDVTGKWG